MYRAICKFIHINSSNIASHLRERGRKEKTREITSAIKENSFQTSCTKAQLPKDTKVQRHKSTGTASNFPETSPKNGAKTQQPSVEKHALKRCCSPETRRKEINYTQRRCRDPLTASNSQETLPRTVRWPSNPTRKKHALKRCSPEQDAKRDTSHKGAATHSSFSIDLEKGTNYLNKEIISSTQGETKSEFSIPPKGEWSSTMGRPTI